MFLVTILTDSSDTSDNSGGCQRKYYCGTWVLELKQWIYTDNYVEICPDFQCICGEETFSYDDYMNNGKECCPPPGGDKCYEDANGDGVCKNGIVIDKRYQTCNHVHFSCDNKTVNNYNLCHGDSLCEDGKDLQECQTKSCDNSRHRKCEEDTKVIRAHKECYDTKKFNDGEFDCLNRIDEKTASEEMSARINRSH